MSIPARLALALLGVIALAGTHWRAYSLGAKHTQNAIQAAQTQAAKDLAAAAIRKADNTIGATHERAKTEQRLSADRLAVSEQLDRLRADLASARATAAAPNACPTDATAQDQLLAAMASDIAGLAERGAQIASAADGHAADTVMLLQACRPTP